MSEPSIAEWSGRANALADRIRRAVAEFTQFSNEYPGFKESKEDQVAEHLNHIDAAYQNLMEARQLFCQTNIVSGGSRRKTKRQHRKRHHHRR